MLNSTAYSSQVHGPYYIVHRKWNRVKVHYIEYILNRTKYRVHNTYSLGHITQNI